MIPAVLPPPTVDAAPAATVDRDDAEEFARALDRETGQGRPSRGAERRAPGRERSEDAPGEHGLEQALAAMPADVPARPVVAALLSHVPPTIDAPADGSDHQTETGLEVGPELPTAPMDPAGLDAAPGPEPAMTDLEPTAADPQPADDPDPTAARPTADGEPTGPEPLRPEADAAAPVGSDDGTLPAAADDAPAATGPALAADEPAESAGAPRRGGEPAAPRAADAPGRTVAVEATPARQDPAPSPAPVGPPAPAAVSAAPAAAAAPPATPAALAQQLVEHVSSLSQGPDGTHDLTIELRPATLGLVRLEITLEDGTLHVRVHAEDPASRRLLAQSMAELRTALTGAGIDAGRLDVGDPGGRDHPSGGTDGEHPGERPAGRPAPAAVAAAPRPTTSRTSVDVLL